MNAACTDQPAVIGFLFAILWKFVERMSEEDENIWKHENHSETNLWGGRLCYREGGKGCQHAHQRKEVKKSETFYHHQYTLKIEIPNIEHSNREKQWGAQLHMHEHQAGLRAHRHEGDGLHRVDTGEEEVEAEVCFSLLRNQIFCKQ